MDVVHNKSLPVVRATGAGIRCLHCIIRIRYLGYHSVHTKTLFEEIPGQLLATNWKCITCHVTRNRTHADGKQVAWSTSDVVKDHIIKVKASDVFHTLH